LKIVRHGRNVVLPRFRVSEGSPQKEKLRER